MAGGDLTDTQWARLQPLLPPQHPKTGRPAKDHRLILNGILWKLRTGAPWRDLPERYGPWLTVYSRFRRWRQAGIWDSILTAVEQEEDAAGQVDWSVNFLDGTVIRAHQHAAGAAHSTADAEALGRSQGGFSTKVHLRADGQGQPVTMVLTPGQRHEATAAERLLDQGAIKRAGRGRPRKRPVRLMGDKGYSSRRLRQTCRRRGIRYTIPRKHKERRTGPFDRKLYRLRERIERLINRCKQYRSIATRYDKLADSYRTLWVIAMTMLWIS